MTPADYKAKLEWLRSNPSGMRSQTIKRELRAWERELESEGVVIGDWLDSNAARTAPGTEIELPFPVRDELRRALLLALRDGEPGYSDDVEAAVADILKLSQRQRRVFYLNGHGTKLGNEIDWVKGADDEGFGYFENVGTKLYQLTEAGRKAAAKGVTLTGQTRIVRAQEPPV